MEMLTFWFIGFERWGALRHEWKIDEYGRKWVPLIRGIWIRRINENRT